MGQISTRMKRASLIAVAALAVAYLPVKSFAIDDETLDKFASNNIMFYDPEGCQPGAITNNTGTILPGNDVYEKVWNFYAQHGFNDYQISGIMGNIKQESAFNPAAHTAKFNSVYGLFQFKKEYNKNLLNRLAEYDKEHGLTGADSVSYYFADDHYSNDGDISLFTERPATAEALLNIQLEYSISDDWDRSKIVTNAADRYKADPPATKLDGTTLTAADYPKYYAEAFEVIYEGAVGGSSKLEYVRASDYNSAWSGEKFTVYQDADLRRNYAADFMKKYGGGAMGGYKIPPANPTPTGGSGIRWTSDGWIEPDSLSGYYKEEVYAKDQANGGYHGDAYFGKEFLTSLPSDSSKKGPNKITLHFTEGGNGSSNGGPVESVAGIYAKYDDNGNQSSSGKQIYASQFTIDLRNKRTYQHGSIFRAGSGVRADDRLAGVQIEIIGFGYENSNKYWDLRNHELFPDESWNYLATLLQGISEATGIPLTKGSNIDFSKPATSQSGRLTVEEFTNYQGILGHQHSPDPDKAGSPAHIDPGPAVWENTEAALKRLGVDTDGSGAKSYGSCGSVSSSSPGQIGALQDAVLKYSYHDYDAERHDPVKDYYDLMVDRMNNGFYVGGDGTAYNAGIDCGAYVSTMMVVSGWDPDYNYGTVISKGAGWTETQLKYLNESPIWEDITSKASDGSEKLKAGDVIIYHTPGTTLGHTLFVAFDENDNEKYDYTSEATSASHNKRAPGADATRIGGLVNVWVNASYNAKVFRKK